MQVKVKILNEKAILPKKGSQYAAGSDLIACLEEPVQMNPHQTVVIPTGIAIELPINTVGLIYARSGLATKEGLAPANKVGVIDCDYRGEIKVALHNHSESIREVIPGQRIAQLVVMPYYDVKFEEVDDLSETMRAEGGFGSSGKL